MRMGHALQLNVINIPALAGDETPVFLAHNACANTFDTHVSLSLPECFPPFPSKCGGFEFVRTVARSRYSAAADTFMRPAASSTDLTMLW